MAPSFPTPPSTLSPAVSSTFKIYLASGWFSPAASHRGRAPSSLSWAIKTASSLAFPLLHLPFYCPVGKGLFYSQKSDRISFLNKKTLVAPLCAESKLQPLSMAYEALCNLTAAPAPSSLADAPSPLFYPQCGLHSTLLQLIPASRLGSARMARLPDHGYESNPLSLLPAS